VPLKVLLADDNASFAAAVKQFLHLLPGTDVVGHARNGDEALALVDRMRPDVLLLDIGMPGKNGFEVARSLRAHADVGSDVRGQPPMPHIVFLSLNDGPAYRGMARELGVTHFVGKADFVAELPPLIQDLCAAHGCAP
jgi:DNA-binding NarL/FixJ family response regulator